MKLKIERNTRIVKKNIYGKPTQKEEYYKVYKPILFGLLRQYLCLLPRSGWELAYEVKVGFCERYLASTFTTKDECERLITDIQNNPNKYVLV